MPSREAAHSSGSQDWAVTWRRSARGRRGGRRTFDGARLRKGHAKKTIVVRETKGGVGARACVLPAMQKCPRAPWKKAPTRERTRSLSRPRTTLGPRSAARLRVATSCVLRGVRSGDAAIERCETRSTHDNTPCTPWPLEPHRAPIRMVMDGAAAYRPSTIPSDRRASSRHAWQQGPKAMPRSSDHRPACLAGRGTGLPISRVPCPRHRPRPTATLVGPHGQSLRPIPFRRFERATSACRWSVRARNSCLAR